MINITEEQRGMLARAWACLCSGNVRVVRTFSDEGMHYLELKRARHRGLCAGELACLLPVLLGTPQKVVAADAFRSVSAVAGTVSRALRAIGLACRANEVPIVAVMSAFAATHAGPADPGVASWLDPSAGRNYVIGVSRPEAQLESALTPSECRVVALRLVGNSHEQVARLLGVSPRTIANHVANAYRKLGVSARFELMNRLLADELPMPTNFGTIQSFKSEPAMKLGAGEPVSWPAH